MDFLRIIRSLEELLYEVITWIIFYPRTMWRVVVHPSVTMGYSDTEQTDSVEEQYLDALQPAAFPDADDPDRSRDRAGPRSRAG